MVFKEKTWQNVISCDYLCQKQAVSMELRTKDGVFSAMVVYGLLTYQNGKVRIPNRELLEKFTEMVQKSRLLDKR